MTKVEKFITYTVITILSELDRMDEVKEQWEREINFLMKEMMKKW